METSLVHIFQVGVEFDVEHLKIRYHGDIEHHPGRPPAERYQLPVPQGVHLIHFQLKTKQPESPPEPILADAMFPSYPVQWLDAQLKTAAQPPSYSGQFFTPYQFVLVIFNAAAFQVPHQFSLAVVYDGKTYVSDPTIINEPPGDDGHGGGEEESKR
jgi:hypothetical protein